MGDPKIETREHALANLSLKESMHEPVSVLRRWVTLRSKHESMREPVSVLRPWVTLRPKHETMRHTSSWLGRQFFSSVDVNFRLL